MPKELMTWVGRTRRWTRQQAGERYWVGLRQLRFEFGSLVTASTKEGSLEAANRWWIRHHTKRIKKPERHDADGLDQLNARDYALEEVSSLSPDDCLFLGDASQELTRFLSDSIDLVVTSPPSEDPGGSSTRFKFEDIAAELWRIITPGGVVAWDVQDRIQDGGETTTSAEQKLFFKKLGFTIHETLVVHVEGIRLAARNRHHRAHRQVFIVTKGRIKTFNPIFDRRNSTSGDGVRQLGKHTNVWSLVAGGNRATARRKIATSQHPAPMPDQLAEDLIRTYSNAGDSVLDPMNGVGTTTAKARELGRLWLGIEIDPEWHRIARMRMAKR